MYELACASLHKILNDLPQYSFTQLNDQVPSDGVYFVFESGETGHEGKRVVRIGSHTGKGNLASRLREHVRLNKDRSIFRKHIGRALLKRDEDPYLPIWNLDLTTRKAREEHAYQIDGVKQAEVEYAVSTYIERNFSVSVLPASDPVAACRFEELCIGIVSLCSHCSPSTLGLGKHADRRIAQSGLWQVMHLYRKGIDDTALSQINGYLEKAKSR